MVRKTRTNDEILTANGLGSMAETVVRILTVWNRSTDTDREAGARWYREDSETVLGALVAAGAPTREAAAAVIAHLSPRTTWARNVAGALALVSEGEAAALALGCMSASVTRAVAALSAPGADAALATLKGPKTSRFARNLLGDSEAVTVDVWAARIAMGACVEDPEKVLARTGVYDACEAAYREAAHRTGVDPTTMQATTWVVARNGRAA